MEKLTELISPERKRAREEAEKNLLARQYKRREELQWLMSTIQGRRFVYGLMAEGRLNGTTFTPDARTSERLEGARDMVTKLALEIISADPEKWLLMQAEAYNAKM